HYAELQAVGVPMTFYISTDLSTEANYDSTWTQAVKDGHEIGNHTVHHCQANLTGCSFGTAPSGDTVANELTTCSSYIPQHTGQSDVWTGASPFGDTGYDSSAQSLFLLYRGVGGGTISATGNTDPYNLPIYLAQTGDTASVFESHVTTAHTNKQWIIFLIHTI